MIWANHRGSQILGSLWESGYEWLPHEALMTQLFDVSFCHTSNGHDQNLPKRILNDPNAYEQWVVTYIILYCQAGKKSMEMIGNE